MNFNMTGAVRDDLAKLAFRLAGDLPKADAKVLLRDMFAAKYDLTPDMAWALLVRGRDLARKAEKAA
jgi:hypothetical protein